MCVNIEATMSVVSYKSQIPSAPDQRVAPSTFLSLGRDQQLNWLEGARIPSAVEALKQCSVVQVQALLCELKSVGYEDKVRQLSSMLGVSTSPSNQGDYFELSTLTHVKHRAPWIVLLALFGIVSGLIIASYEDTLSQLLLLAVYMPVIAAAGGNTGTQAATLITRGLALGTITPRHWFKVLRKESRIAVWIAAIVSSVMVARIIFVGDSNGSSSFDIELIAIAISIALSIQIILSTLLGGVMPLIAHKLKMDPAVMVSPILASLVDISGIWIYFSTVNWYLGLS
jgi:Mg/Co/Ni transporter MgtE